MVKISFLSFDVNPLSLGLTFGNEEQFSDNSHLPSDSVGLTFVLFTLLVVFCACWSSSQTLD
jgi:hypothetical protein